MEIFNQDFIGTFFPQIHEGPEEKERLTNLNFHTKKRKDIFSFFFLLRMKISKELFVFKFHQISGLFDDFL